MDSTAIVKLINFSISTAGSALMLLGLLLVLLSRNIDLWTRYFFIVFFSFLTAYVASDLGYQIFNFFSDNALPLSILLFLESFFSSLLMPLLSIYLLHCCRERIRSSRLLTEEHAPHIALSNIHDRLLRCGGTVDITPREGGGTVVTLRIPYRTGIPTSKRIMLK